MPTKEQIRDRVEKAAEAKLAKAIDREADWKASEMVREALADTEDDGDDSGEYLAVPSAETKSAPAAQGSMNKVTILQSNNPRLHGYKG